MKSIHPHTVVVLSALVFALTPSSTFAASADTTVVTTNNSDAYAWLTSYGPMEAATAAWCVGPHETYTENAMKSIARVRIEMFVSGCQKGSTAKNTLVDAHSPKVLYTIQGKEHNYAITTK